MKILMLLLGLLILGALWALPLYVCANLVLWLFHIPFRWTLLQTLGVCMLISVIRGLFFTDKGGR
jgi:hypothetical protein